MKLMLTVQFLVISENGVAIFVARIQTRAFSVSCVYPGAEVKTAWLRILTSPVTTKSTVHVNGW